MRRPTNRTVNLVSKIGTLCVRGTAQQISQRYMTLASETEDEMMAQNYLQHAEHYNRIGEEQTC